MVGLVLPDPGSLRVPRCNFAQQSAPQAQPLSLSGRRTSSTRKLANAMQRQQTCRSSRRERVVSLRVKAMSDDPTLITEGALPRSAVVGVLGGGQLGKMLAIEAVSNPRPLPPLVSRSASTSPQCCPFSSPSIRPQYKPPLIAHNTRSCHSAL